MKSSTFKTTYYMPAEAREWVKKIPRYVSISLMVRVIVMAFALPREEYMEALKKDSKLSNAREMIREKLFGKG